MPSSRVNPFILKVVNWFDVITINIAECVRAQDWRPGGSGFESCWHFGTLAIPFTQCLSEETLKDVGPFYLVSLPWALKDPRHGVIM